MAGLRVVFRGFGEEAVGGEGSGVLGVDVGDVCQVGYGGLGGVEFVGGYQEGAAFFGVVALG